MIPAYRCTDPIVGRRSEVLRQKTGRVRSREIFGVPIFKASRNPQLISRFACDWCCPSTDCCFSKKEIGLPWCKENALACSISELLPMARHCTLEGIELVCRAFGCPRTKGGPVPMIFSFDGQTHFAIAAHQIALRCPCLITP